MSKELNKAPVEQAEPASCQGTNCGTTTGDHSSECLVEAAASQGWELKPGDLCGRDCPMRPATAEQAGGDEHVIGWRERILAAHPNSDPGFWPDALLVEHMAAEIADLRAALAQPSGEVVVTKNESGAIVSVTRQDKEGRVLSVIAESQPSPAPTTSGYDQLWGWFGLSRSAYAVLPRVMMHAMPDDWQARFAELMDKWDDHWPNQPDITAHVQIKQNNRFISTPPWLLNYRHPDHNQLNAMRGKDEL
ncbi:TPA: hypothetical protein ACXLB5_003952 [Pseudomonas aeruginosa]